jgi:hypothetical protein
MTYHDVITAAWISKGDLFTAFRVDAEQRGDFTASIYNETEFVSTKLPLSTLQAIPDSNGR